MLVGGSAAVAAGVDVEFVIDPMQSELEVTAGVSFFSGSDTQALAGTVNALLDFGGGADFPSVAELTVTSGNVMPTGNYLITIAGLQTVRINDAAADITTLNPPGTMTQMAGTNVTYQFDAADLSVSLNQGTVIATGLAESTVDLAAEPVTNSAPAGTFGSIEFTAVTTSGPYRTIAAVMTLPIELQDTIDVNGVMVNVTAAGVVVADASFVIALPAIATDFDMNLSVDADDLAIWQSNFGLPASATTATGDADGDGAVSGGDYLLWQHDNGLAPPAPAAAAVPEPTAALLAAAALAVAIVRGRRSA
ncbi:MAG: hypothetical protein CMJ58_11820 [Planctomycetaceae bacterium]|nr:hypothetical protein [Planctomycetaceae bacterium]